MYYVYIGTRVPWMAIETNFLCTIKQVSFVARVCDE